MAGTGLPDGETGAAIVMLAVMAATMWIAAGVLGCAGVAKIVHPDGARAALRRAGLPSGAAAARSLGVAETTIAGTALLTGGPLAAPLAAAYAGLAIFSHRARRRPLATCGCFGDAEAPLTRAHVVINTGAALFAGAAALAGAPGLAAVTSAGPGVVTAVLISTASATCLAMQFLTTVPTLAAQMSRSGSEGQ